MVAWAAVFTSNGKADTTARLAPHDTGHPRVESPLNPRARGALHDTVPRARGGGRFISPVITPNTAPSRERHPPCMLLATSTMLK